MIKTVKYNGNSIKVEFNKSNHTRVIDEKIGDSITKAHGTETFTINGKSYVINWSMTRKEKASKTLSFEGFSCGDSEKKIVEFIISKYGTQQIN